ncbi:MAG TPA: 16S rRNA (guanine(966)-N(2))-methyltransferase RsmD [Candidatus Omnitrophota bacterium]|nr:16S rRNA (guanine(966)-N(2))-methyltransferase RsmD [Candidatus Omnitrophota bacterium]HPD85615.1 16S rRNA (guanine(966)-N(2))-methyltransferase RsmD [Candidatus Omnitrophota bacterium]HRZ04458.1 16S rRNA (guanine(966)-N(2))-methyltransferase RsmD [Candidatus Omnitrophota bacterium]
MKILGGKLHGRNFYMPEGIRPTSDLIRRAVFDILGHDLEGLDFLDLFAGSGSVGLEAISRNAKRVVFVEKEGLCAKVIQENLTLLKITGYDTYQSPFFVINSDTFSVIRQMHKRGEKFNIVFIDPPYGLELAKKTLKTLIPCDILHRNCFIVLQHDKKESLPAEEGRFSLITQRRYGNSFLSIYEGKE